MEVTTESYGFVFSPSIERWGSFCTPPYSLAINPVLAQGEVTQGNDRLRVLINRAPKRHRSITAIGFFLRPQNVQAPPVPPMPTPVATKRPLPRFLEIFEPLNASEPACPSSSSLSTPLTSDSSLPSTPPCLLLREVGDDNDVDYHSHPSYFPSIPAYEMTHGQALMDSSRAHRQNHGIAEILPVAEESKEANLQDSREQQQQYTFRTTRSDRSFEWPTGHEHHEGNVLMMDGTFGRA